MGKYINLTEKDFDSTINEGISIVDFWAPWCGPCRMIAPVIEQLGEELEGQVKVCKVNTDEEQNIAVKFGIRSIPTILFFKNGVVKEQMVGANSKQAILQTLERVKIS